MSGTTATARSPAGPASGAGRPAVDVARHAPTLILVSAGLLYLYFTALGSVAWNGRTYFTLFDDAMISMRYAKTLAAGGGFTWNPGEVPIEGITNPLWTLWMALLHLVPVPEGYVALLVSISAGALLLATAVAARSLARLLGAGPNLELAALALVAFYYPLAFWSLRGMETGALACLMAWSMVLALRQLDAPDPRRTAVLAAMAAALVLVRQDAVVFIAVLAGFVWLNGPTRHRMTWATLVGAMVAALVVLMAFRLAYYGDLLPNTYYLKVTGVTTMERWKRGLESLLSEEMRGHLLLVAVTLVLSIPGALLVRRARLARWALPLAVFVAQAAYSAHVGGDVWEMMGYPNRYIVIAMPGLLVVTLILMRGLAARLSDAPTFDGAVRQALFRLLLATLVGLLVAQTSARHALAGLRGEAAYVQYDRATTQVGLCLRQHTPASARIAYVWAGAMPYYADRWAIDLLGKMDAHIARGMPQIPFVPGHNKWDTQHSIDAHKPDIILQVWGDKPADLAIIKARGYTPIDAAWPCFANTFLVKGLAFERR